MQIVPDLHVLVHRANDQSLTLHGWFLLLISQPSKIRQSVGTGCTALVLGN